ncbi:9575_t:CDS:2, partial [Scutellospora calospora]
MELILNDISYSEAIDIKTINTFDPVIKNALPCNYKYFIDLFEQIQLYSFLGAYETPFKINCRINILTIEESKVWLQQFMNLHKVTMRETHDCTVKGKHKNDESYTVNTRIRDTNCPTTLSIQILKRTDPYP